MTCDVCGVQLPHRSSSTCTNSLYGQASVPVTLKVLLTVRQELERAQALFPRPAASAHEAFAILNEEVDELWDEVRGKSNGDQTDRKRRMRKEAIQVAAMAIRFIEEVCDG